MRLLTRACWVLAAVFAECAFGSARVSVDPASVIATVSSHLYLYGEGATESLARATALEIEAMWNEPRVSVPLVVPGGKLKTYRVRFEIESSVIGEAGLDERIYSETDCRNNYVEVGGADLPMNEFSRSHWHKATNVGWFNVQDGIGVSSTAAHEYGHGLGLGHPGSPRISGQPGIMAPRGTFVDRKYRISASAKPGEPGSTLDVRKRRVLPIEVESLFHRKLDFDSNLEACLGVVKPYVQLAPGEWIDLKDLRVPPRIVGPVPSAGAISPAAPRR